MSTSEQTFQMMWDCKYCGQKKLLGISHRFCGACGGPQDAAARYFPPEGEAVAVENHVYAGADVQCAGCGHWNGRAANCCTFCGAPVGGRSAPLRPEMGLAPNPSPGFAGAGAVGFAAPPKKKSHTVLAVVFGALFVMVMGIVGLLCVAAFWTREGTVEVAGHAWQREIALETFATVRATAWCDELPAGARTLSRRDETRSTDKIPDGETCTTRKKDQGDGTFKQIRECTPKYKERAVKAPRCEYESERWQNGRTVKAQGSSLREAPAWPVTNLRAGSCIGCEREAKRTEKYTVSFVEPKTKKTLSCDVPVDRWSQRGVGSKWKADIGAIVDTIDCAKLQSP